MDQCTGKVYTFGLAPYLVTICEISLNSFGFRALDMQTGEIVAVKRISVEDTKVEDDIMVWFGL